jgi:hypothetical protein
MVEPVVLVSCLLELGAQSGNFTAAPALGETHFLALRVTVTEPARVFVNHRFSQRSGSPRVPR